MSENMDQLRLFHHCGLPDTYRCPRCSQQISLIDPEIYKDRNQYRLSNIPAQHCLVVKRWSFDVASSQYGFALLLYCADDTWKATPLPQDLSHSFDNLDDAMLYGIEHVLTSVPYSDWVRAL